MDTNKRPILISYGVNSIFNIRACPRKQHDLIDLLIRREYIPQTKIVIITCLATSTSCPTKSNRGIISQLKCIAGYAIDEELYLNLFTTIHDGNFRRHSSMNVAIK